MTFADYNITIPQGRTTGQAYTTCPECSHERKKKNAKCLSVNLDLGVWNCKNCNWSGSLHKKQYSTPKWENKTDLPDSIVDWFMKRNINQSTVNDLKISFANVWMPQVEATKKCICFNYFRDGKLVNIKYRDREKNFRLYKDAELILYNYDGITGQKVIYITEGECDAMIMIQSGFKATCSVPNGANPKNNNLEYMDNCWQAFEAATSVYIITDNDAPGNRLADELARRIGVERCYRVDLREFKDVNDAVNAGEYITTEWIEDRSTPYPLLGVFQAENFWGDLLDIRKNGFPKGWKPRAPFGNHVTIHPGYTTIITGIPSHGKSEHLDQILMELGVDYDLKGAYFSPENFPTSMHLIKMVEKITGQNFWESKIDDINSIKQWINDHFVWIYPDDGFNLTNVLEHIRKAVLKHGVNWYVIDPWNKLDHQFTGPETSYISRCLDEIDTFNKKNNVHAFIVAHPTKMEKDKDGTFIVPNLYSISGSAHFFNKTSLGWTVYKRAQNQSEVHIQKVKFKYWGEIGLINYIWDPKNGRYYTINPDYSHWLNKTPKDPVLSFSEPSEDDTSDLPF